MAERIEDTAPKLRDSQIGSSWIPATPAKPHSFKQQPICTPWQETNPVQTNWVESEIYTTANLVKEANLSESGSLTSDFLQEAQCTFYGSTNLVNASGNHDNWQAGEASSSNVRGDKFSDFGDTWRKDVNSHVYGDYVSTFDKCPTGDGDKLTNMSFRSLLELAHSGGDRSAVQNALTYTNFVTTTSTSTDCFHPYIEEGRSGTPLMSTDFGLSSSSLAPHFHPLVGGSQSSMISFQNSSLQNQEYDARLNIPNVIMDGSSNPHRPIFDLNSPPRTTTDAALSKNTPSEFEPITPQKTSKAENKQEAATDELRIDEVAAGKDTLEKNITSHGVTEPQEKNRKSHLIVDQSTQLQENEERDKGSIEEADLSKTPQQKARRKKHRPKVIIEGQRTPKTSAKKQSVPGETTTAKRKYVRRKGVNNPLGEETNENEMSPSSLQTPGAKRSRKKGTNTPEKGIDMGTSETTPVMEPRVTRNSCRRSLNFDADGLVRDESSLHRPTSDLDRELEDYLSKATMNPTKDDHMLAAQTISTRGKCQIVFSDVTHDKEANSVQVRMNPSDQTARKILNDSNCNTPERQEGGLKRKNIWNRNESGTFYNSLQAYLPIFSQYADNSDGIPGLQFPATYKKKRSEKAHSVASSSFQYAASTSTNRVKLERRDLREASTKAFTSTTKEGSSGAQYQVATLLMTTRATYSSQNGRQIFEDLLALGPTEKIRKRRSKGSTRLRDLDSLCKELPTTSRIKQGIEILNEPHTCMEALVADTRSTMKTKKRSKRSMHINSTVQNLCNQQKSFLISMGPPPLALTWKSVSPIDSIIEQMNQLDLNAEKSLASTRKQNMFIAYHTFYQDQHAIVPFQGHGGVVPFDSSFDQVRRRRPRPKVDLDDETNRVWKLLLENINSEGIDGTDEEKTKWWEEERRVFRGRADSFIARMHLVQGDRRFSPWKGSVVDSVVGVFLTQNVSDHLSSSAFMSVAARFPINSNTHPVELHEERLGTQVKEPEVCVLDPDESSGPSKEIINQSAHDEDIKKLEDFEDDGIREVDSVKSSGTTSDGFVLKECVGGQSTDTATHEVVSQETVANKSVSYTEDGRDAEDTLSSQNPEISSQNSADSPITQSTERSDSCLMSTSAEEPTAGLTPNRFTSSTSFVKLLQMAGTVLHGVYKNDGVKRSKGNWQVQSENMALNMQNEDHLGNSTFPAKTIASCSKSTRCHPPNSGEQVTEFDLSQKNMFFKSSSKEEHYAADVSELSSESASGTTFRKVTAVSFEDGQKFSSPNDDSGNDEQIQIIQKVDGNQTGQVPAESLLKEDNKKMHKVSQVPTYPQNLMDVTGSSSVIDNCMNSEHKEVNSNNKDPDYHPGEMVNGPKSKGGRPRKEKGDPVDWDHLRKHTRTGGRERAKTANTMDSVDWDAVRCANVNELAQTIKERGMNNMLAERIKDFLNRLVRDHGSIDLEWLRDVPPDQAKEYLLSIRGLGLKSVECVRLLTLHHLAFPVDTNVGRIAVRLGWVPLQPLPESLQLHLLELYPILESIQKYLWPRLCKLDQRTLYELHYQMITFGKVFCTKSKPNCNACPMRGECRHFASAFASARLALPGPEERGIVSATENRIADQKQMRSMDTLQLPPPQVNEMVAKSGVSNSQPIIEEPPSPEPIIEVPATPEPCYTEVPEHDIENDFAEDPDEIPTIQLNMEEFTHNLHKIMQQNSDLQGGDMSKALVALTSEAASIPVPKLKNVNRLRTEHQVYELPDSHPLLNVMDKREPDDPSPYLLAIWTPGETMDSIEPPAKRCSSQEFEKLCADETCSSCNSIREANSQTVRGTLLIPCRTAMRGSFPLNGTYFQVNEVFSDHESSLSPIDVPRQWLWNLPRRTVYFGTSIPTIFKGLSTEGIQYCFWRGFVCVRGFDRKTRAPRPLIARLHFPASRLTKGKGKIDEDYT